MQSKAATRMQGIFRKKQSSKLLEKMKLKVGRSVDGWLGDIVGANVGLGERDCVLKRVVVCVYPACFQTD